VNGVDALDEVLDRLGAEEDAARVCAEGVHDEVHIHFVEKDDDGAARDHALEDGQGLEAGQRAVRERGADQGDIRIMFLSEAEYFRSAGGAGHQFELADVGFEAAGQEFAAKRSAVRDEQAGCARPFDFLEEFHWTP